MVKPWKKIFKVLGTTTLFLLYLTIELFSNQNFKEKTAKPLNFVFGPTSNSEKLSATIKTVVAYSREFKIKEELEGQIKCKARSYPETNELEEGATKWKHDLKLDIHLYSAYYDRRENPYDYVRVLGLFPRNLSLYCQIWYERNDTVTYVTQKADYNEIWSTKWGATKTKCEDKYPAIASCLIPSQFRLNSVLPKWVSFTTDECNGDGTFIKVKSPEPVPRKINFMVCVKPLHFTNVDQKTFYEWVDINRKVGADQITVYASDPKIRDIITKKSGVSKSDKILVVKEFQALEVNCTSRTFEDSLWYKRKMEIIAYNDCLYSNLYSTKFVVPLDLDEIIVPKIGNNWLEGFRSHFQNPKLLEKTRADFHPRNYASFSVRNAYFFSEYPKDAIVRSKLLPKNPLNVPKKLVKVFSKNNMLSGNRGRNKSIFDRTVRSYRLSPKTDSVKSFVHVPDSLSVFNHFTFHVLGTAAHQYIFPQDVFQLNHYRNKCDPILIDGCSEFMRQIVFDDSLKKLWN